MNDVENVLPDKSRRLGLGSITLRIVIALNFVRFALSFLPWFEGTEHSAGFADRLFNPIHADGFRSDFLWLIVSSVFVIFAMFVYVPEGFREKTARTNVFLGFAWLLAFCFRIQESRHRRPRFRLTILGCI
jgi:hypothetical protein